MRRDIFLKSLAAVAGAATLSSSARTVGPSIKMMIPANLGGGWDATARALGKAMLDCKTAEAVNYTNKGGAAGVLGLAQFVNNFKNDPDALLVMGAVMLGGLIASKAPVSLSDATPIARLSSEYNVFVLPANSPFKNLQEVVKQLKMDPGSVRWDGGSRGSTEHIAAAMIAQKIGADPSKINYVPFRGGGEAIAAILGGNVAIGGSGYSEFADYIKAGRIKAIAVTSAERLPGVDIPTLKEQGIDVEIGNWRGVYGAPGITSAQRQALIEVVLAALKSASWVEAIKRNSWSPAVLSGDAFARFVDDDFSSLRATMLKSGMV